MRGSCCSDTEVDEADLFPRPPHQACVCACVRVWFERTSVAAAVSPLGPADGEQDQGCAKGRLRRGGEPCRDPVSNAVEVPGSYLFTWS
ncbi:hypothetical protein NHX12_004254 [Muraenolepis orangiensis]|uniref:Uncharacterized protein n=1 Tax=Muraenolepis orangiensis TaxID=630683 RepID=A0A9Q0DSH3_9TELE|nr:hypothetical protein NHX12_004254 [Muraenolepis orangiensis]